MKAILSREPGGPETLSYEEVAMPEPGPLEVRIAVKACAINYPDVLIIQDKYQARPARPFSPGAEIAGVIDALGSEVAGVAVGDRVMAQPGVGGLAERVVVAGERITPMPDALSFAEGAAMMVAYGTGYYALKHCAALAPGEKLLVLGAAGGVGLAAVELGKALGARVLAAVSSESKADFARSHGADESIVYPRSLERAEDRKSLGAQFKQMCGAGGADVVYDAVGGDFAELALRTLGWRGRYLVVGFAAGIPSIPLNLALLNGRQILGVFWGEWTRRDLGAYRADVGELFELYFRGRIRPTISATYELRNAADALTHMANRRAIGKLVVTVP